MSESLQSRPARRLFQPLEPISGVGLHRGQPAKVRIGPARPGAGLRFIVAGGSTPLPASLDAAITEGRRTSVVGPGGAAVETVEHLLAAFYGLGISDARIEVEGPELPALDGSAAPWARALLDASERTRSGGCLEITRRFIFADGRGGMLGLAPAQGLSVACSVDFKHRRIGRQRFCYDASADDFSQMLAPARTFGLAEDAETLRRRGLARGASLGNVVVFSGRDELLNPEGLRFVDEVARHKTLDLLGDLALLGPRIQGAITAHRPSHRTTVAALSLARSSGVLRWRDGS